MRKEELVQAASDLFHKKGYENTSVSDIVRRLNVAQGTFYYHFPSKEAVLKAVVRKIIDRFEERIGLAQQRAGDSAKDQLFAILRVLPEIAVENPKVVEFLHRSENAAVHQSIMQEGLERLLPLLARTVELGVAQGDFRMKRPLETSEYILAAISYFMHHPDIRTPGPRRTALFEALEESVNRALGANLEGLLQRFRK